MDDFQKIYNNIEEKRVTGFIFVFIIMLILVEPLYAVIFMFQTARAFAVLPWAGNLYQCGCAGYIILIFFTCFSFYKIPKHSVNIAKTLLVVRFLFLMLSIIVNFIYTLHDPNAIGVRVYQFSSIQDMIIKIFIIPTVYVSVFSLGWYLFIKKSKTVRRNYPSAELASENGK